MFAEIMQKEGEEDVTIRAMLEGMQRASTQELNVFYYIMATLIHLIEGRVSSAKVNMEEVTKILNQTRLTARFSQEQREYFKNILEILKSLIVISE